MADNYYKLYAPPPVVRYYVAPRMTIPGLYGSSVMISIPEPDGEVMITILDHDGKEVTDVYVNVPDLIRAITEVEEAYEAIPEESRSLPTRPAANMPLPEGPHP